ncbi:MAG: ribokinase [Pseudomonadota bacterium]
MSVRIGVVGSVNLDLVASGAPLPRAGETVTGARFSQHPGGKGANQALAAQRLGADVFMVGRTGDDALAEPALELLRRDGVDVSRVMSEIGQSTGVALISVAPDGENQITVASGANGMLGEDAAADLPDCHAVLCQLEVPIAAIESAAQRAKACGALFAVNLAPAIELEAKLLAQIDLVIVNELEAAFYGDSLYADNRLVAVTLGAKGSAFFKGKQEISRAPSYDVPVLDTTGAGDTFCAALVLALAEGKQPEDALEFASAAAALSVTQQGAQTSLPWRADVEDLLEDNKT